VLLALGALLVVLCSWTGAAQAERPEAPADVLEVALAAQVPLAVAAVQAVRRRVRRRTADEVGRGAAHGRRTPTAERLPRIPWRATTGTRAPPVLAS